MPTKKKKKKIWHKLTHVITSGNQKRPLFPNLLHCKNPHEGCDCFTLLPFAAPHLVPQRAFPSLSELNGISHPPNPPSQKTQISHNNLHHYCVVSLDHHIGSKYIFIFSVPWVMSSDYRVEQNNSKKFESRREKLKGGENF